MTYLKYSINGNNKKIKVDNIDSIKNSSNDNHLVKYNKSNYEYIIEKKEQDTFKKLLQLLHLWNEFTKENNINYWACGGTLLGAIRHKGFIPWDNDIDVSIMLPDFEKVKKKLDKHKKLSYVESKFGIKLYIENKFPFIDVFICDYHDDSSIKFCGILVGGKPTWTYDKCFPNQHIYKNELYPLKEVKFENTTIMVPNIQKCLFRTFSKKCLTEFVISNHVKGHENLIKLFINETETKIIKKIDQFEEKYNIPKIMSYLIYSCNNALFTFKNVIDI